MSLRKHFTRRVLSAAKTIDADPTKRVCVSYKSNTTVRTYVHRDANYAKYLQRMVGVLHSVKTHGRNYGHGQHIHPRRRKNKTPWVTTASIPKSMCGCDPEIIRLVIFLFFFCSEKSGVRTCEDGVASRGREDACRG